MAFVRLVALAAMASLASAFHPLLAGQPAAPRGPAAWSPVVMRAVEDRPVADAEVVEVVAAAAPEPSTRVAVPVVSVPQVPVEAPAAAKVLPAGSKRARARQALSKMPLLGRLAGGRGGASAAALDADAAALAEELLDEACEVVPRVRDGVGVPSSSSCAAASLVGRRQLRERAPSATFFAESRVSSSSPGEDATTTLSRLANGRPNSSHTRAVHPSHG